MDAVRRQRLLDQGSHALGEEHVGGEEDLHVPRHLGAGLFALAPERRGNQRRDLGHAFSAQVHRHQQRSLGARHVARNAQMLGFRGDVLRRQAQLVDLNIHVERRLAAGAGQGREQRARDLRVGFLRQFADVSVVVLQRLLLLTFQTAVDEQHDQDQEHYRHARRDAAAHHQRVAVYRRPAPMLRSPRQRSPRRSRLRSGAGRCLLAIVEKRQKSLLAGTLEAPKYDCRPAALRSCKFSVRPAVRAALAAARLAHPAIVALYEAGTVDNAFYLISELVDGDTYAQLIAGGALADEDVLEIGLALADALAHAHARGVVHRDIKPHNVLVPREPEGAGGAAKLTDFGGASLAGEDALTRTGS